MFNKLKTEKESLERQVASLESVKEKLGAEVIAMPVDVTNKEEVRSGSEM